MADQAKEHGFPIHFPPGVRMNSGRVVAQGCLRAVIVATEIGAALTEVGGVGAEGFELATRVFEFENRTTDSVILQTADGSLPLIIRRDGDLIVNFDIEATRAFRFFDSKRPIYTFIPGFNICMVPTSIRRPVSNLIEAMLSLKAKRSDRDYSRLSLTSFEIVVLILHMAQANARIFRTRLFEWPCGRRSAFVPLHDVDTLGLLRRRERDPLFRLEQDHRIRSTWFIPTKNLRQNGKADVDFLLEAGHEVGWHGHKHDHRLPFRPFADRSASALNASFLVSPANYPTGMRAPKLLKSNYLFELLDRTCSSLRYDTSFSGGIVPYYLWANGIQTRILEIPVTVPTDIAVYNGLRGIPRSRRPEAVLEAQIARTRRLLEVGGLISIVTHPEKDLSERPDLIEIYDRYLCFITKCPDIWFTTAGEVYKYWTSNAFQPSGQI